jgi:hypothetical protein
LYRRLCRPSDRIENFQMGSAAAEVACKSPPDLAFAGVGVGSQERHGRHDHAVQAVPALSGLRLAEGLLNWLEPTVFGQSFQGCNRSPIEFDCGDDARSRRTIINQYGTSATLTQSAAVTRSIEM